MSKCHVVGNHMSRLILFHFREFSLSGDYRHIVVQPSDVSWQAFRYDDVTIPLALSDYDRLNGVSEPESLKGGSEFK